MEFMKNYTILSQDTNKIFTSIITTKTNPI